jgi:hypothetical protein
MGDAASLALVTKGCGLIQVSKYPPWDLFTALRAPPSAVSLLLHRSSFASSLGAESDNLLSVSAVPTSWPCPHGGYGSPIHPTPNLQF